MSAIPQYEGFGNLVDRVAQPAIGAFGFVRHPASLGDVNGDAGEVQRLIALILHGARARPKPDPVSVPCANPEFMVEEAGVSGLQRFRQIGERSVVGM